MIPDHIKTYPMDELQESAYQRFADILYMYAGPILEETRPFAPTWSRRAHCLPMLRPGWRSVLLHWVWMNG